MTTWTDVRIRTMVLRLLGELVRTAFVLFMPWVLCYVPPPLPTVVLASVWLLITVLVCVSWVLHSRLQVLAREMRRQLKIKACLKRTLAELKALP